MSDQAYTKSVKALRRQYIEIAEDLGYSEDTIDKIRNSDSEFVMQGILAEARNHASDMVISHAKYSYAEKRKKNSAKPEFKIEIPKVSTVNPSNKIKTTKPERVPVKTAWFFNDIKSFTIYSANGRVFTDCPSAQDSMFGHLFKWNVDAKLVVDGKEINTPAELDAIKTKLVVGWNGHVFANVDAFVKMSAKASVKGLAIDVTNTQKIPVKSVDILKEYKNGKVTSYRIKLDKGE